MHIDIQKDKVVLGLKKACENARGSDLSYIRQENWLTSQFLGGVGGGGQSEICNKSSRYFQCVMPMLWFMISSNYL